ALQAVALFKAGRQRLILATVFWKQLAPLGQSVLGRGEVTLTDESVGFAEVGRRQLRQTLLRFQITCIPLQPGTQLSDFFTQRNLPRRSATCRLLQAPL